MRDDSDGEPTSASAAACLRLAQRMLRANRAGAMRRLRLPAEVAAMLEAFTLVQLRRLAASNFALCSFRLVELPIAAFGGPFEAADCAQPDKALAQTTYRDPGDMWAGLLLRVFAAVGLIVQLAALTIALAPSLAARCQSLVTFGGAAMGLLAVVIVCCWARGGSAYPTIANR